MSTIPTIRTAGAGDIAAIQRLSRERGGHFDERLWRSIPGQRYLLVLDGPDGSLAAAAQVVLEGRRGHLSMLTIAKAFEGTGVEDRMIGVIEAMCDAFGIDTLDVPPRRAA